MGKHTVKTVRVKVMFKDLGSKDWKRIFSIPFPPATRMAMGLLFAHHGKGRAGEFLQGTWSRAMQINRLFVKHKLPYRLRGFTLPEEEQIKSGFHIDTLELRLCTVCKPRKLS